MKKMFNKALKGFTLVELIVVIAIIAILSTVGFVSYTGYIRDSRNSVRQSDLAEAVNVITQFIATEGRAPSCSPANSNYCNFANLNVNGGGIDPADWAKLNVRKAPVDPKKTSNNNTLYYQYGKTATDFWLFATKEEANGSFTALVAGSKDGGDPNATGFNANANMASCTGIIPGGSCIPYTF
jgi:prepilin-type N-terminal cleavage/methylation domain-containing protein